MPDFTVQSDFQLFAPDNLLASPGGQIVLGQPIGGGESASDDGLDETTGLVDDNHHNWARRRAVVFTLSPVNALSVANTTEAASTTSASFTTIQELPVTLADGVAGLAVEYDMEDGTLQVGVYNASTAVLITSASAAETTRASGSISLSGVTVSEVFVRLELKRTTTEAVLHRCYGLEAVATL